MQKKLILKSIAVLLNIIFFSINCLATDVNSKAKKSFEAGLEAVEKDDYLLAVSHLEAAVKIDANESEYHRWLGRTYSLCAKHSSWFKAAGWARKAKKSFEFAVDVEPENIEALLDLREFYRQAPGMVGGSNKRAKEITEKLEALGYRDDSGLSK